MLVRNILSLTSSFSNRNTEVWEALISVLGESLEPLELQRDAL